MFCMFDVNAFDVLYAYQPTHRILLQKCSCILQLSCLVSPTISDEIRVRDILQAPTMATSEYKCKESCMPTPVEQPILMDKILCQKEWWDFHVAIFRDKLYLLPETFKNKLPHSNPWQGRKPMIEMQDGHCLDRKPVNIHYPHPWSIKLLCLGKSKRSMARCNYYSSVLLRFLEWGERRLSPCRLN